MHKDRIIGAGKQFSGTMKQAVGKLVGDVRLQLNGRAERVAGKLQTFAGRVKDRLRG